MAENTSALMRYHILDVCFRRFGKGFCFEDLLNELNDKLLEDGRETIARTQLYKDIAFMESEAGWSVRLERTRQDRKVYFSYVNKDFSIRKTALELGEIEKIKASLAIMSKLKFLPQFDWLNETIFLLNDKLKLSNNSQQIIYLEDNTNYTGRKYIEPIYEAITNKKVLEIAYQRFESSTTDIKIFQPYILKEFNNRWFVLGKDKSTEYPITILALDRIKTSQTSNEKYRNYTWNESYFDDILGVTKMEENKLEEVKLWFSAEQSNYIRTKPIHKSQKVIETLESGETIISIKVIPNHELEMLILSYAERVKVLSPESFRQRILARVQMNFEQKEKKN